METSSPYAVFNIVIATAVLTLIGQAVVKRIIQNEVAKKGGSK